MDHRTQATESSPGNYVGDHSPVIESRALRFSGLECSRQSERLAIEEPLEIQLVFGPAEDRKTKSISVTMRTPGQDFELAAGFLLSENVITHAYDVEEIQYATDQSPSESAAEKLPVILSFRAHRNRVRVLMRPEVQFTISSLERNFYTTSSCGVCGKASLLALRTACPPRPANDFSFDPVLLYRLPERLRSAQPVFNRTGGLHAAALFDGGGSLRSLREDVGRHNAVDKLIGAAVLENRIPLLDRLLMLSGRASFELLQKAAMSGIQMVVSIGAPSSLAVEVARDFDITLVGFLRDDHFNVYHGSEHLLLSRPGIEVHS